MATVSLFTSCKKGDTGPVGPSGQNGTNGTNVTNGNANVVGTNSVIISNWALNSVVYNADITTVGITQDIVDRGLVSVLRKYVDGWSPLPDISGLNVTNFDFELGIIHLYNFNSDGSTLSYPRSIEYSVVIISSSRRAHNPGVDWNDYEQVIENFNKYN